MFKWLKNKFKKKKTYPLEDNLKGKVLASMRYVVGIDETIYLDFFWDSDAHVNANEAFSDLFYQINTGELLETSVDFIKETCKEEKKPEEFLRFFSNVMKLQKMDTESEAVEEDNEVVVKPTDVTVQPFGGNQI